MVLRPRALVTTTPARRPQSRNGTMPAARREEELGLRPQGVIRMALRQAALKLAEERGGATWREIASSAEVRVEGAGVAGETVQRGVAPGVARETVKNMVRSGELAEVGRQKRAGSKHYQALYVPAEPRFGVEASSNSAAPLGDVVRDWAHAEEPRGA